MKILTSTSQSRYHPNRRFYNRLVYAQTDRMLARLANKIQGDVCDLGCGEMPYREWILAGAKSYTGVDWGSSLHELKADVLADLNDGVPLPDQSADTVISLSVMEHLHTPQTLVNEAFRLLRPGGHAIMQVPWQWGVHEAPHDYHRFTPFALVRMLETAGFQQVEVSPSGGGFSTLALRFNYLVFRSMPETRICRWMLLLPLIPMMVITQFLAQYLDQLDKDWSVDAPGYWVVGIKTKL